MRSNFNFNNKSFNSLQRAIIYVLIGIFLLDVMGIIIKSMDNKYSIMQYAVARNFFGSFPLFIYLFLFLLLRLSLSTCPRCNKRFYSLLNIIFNGSFYSKSGMWAVSCNSCGLKLSELPEVDEVTIKSHKDEWFK